MEEVEVVGRMEVRVRKEIKRIRIGEKVEKV